MNYDDMYLYETIIRDKNNSIDQYVEFAWDPIVINAYLLARHSRVLRVIIFMWWGEKKRENDFFSYARIRKTTTEKKCSLRREKGLLYRTRSTRDYNINKFLRVKITS